MAFWDASALVDADTGETKSFVLQAPDDYSEEKVRSTILEVHPEYLNLDLVSIEKPDWIPRAYGEEEESDPKETFSRAQAQQATDAASSKKRRLAGKLSS